jgi:hypothetical protein
MMDKEKMIAGFGRCLLFELKKVLPRRQIGKDFYLSMNYLIRISASPMTML